MEAVQKNKAVPHKSKSSKRFKNPQKVKFSQWIKTREGKKEVLNSVIAILIAVIFLFPIYWLVQLSFKSDTETFGRVLTYFPHEFTIDPWLVNLQNKTFLQSLSNSFLNGLLTMAVTLILGVPAAYGMGRYKVKGTNVFLLTFLVSQMLPASLTLTPLYLIFNKIGLLGNHLAAPLAIACGSIAFAVVTLRPYFKSVPVALDEAARLDGCGTIRAFLQVMIPAVKTGIVTIVVISFLNGWNDLVFSQTFNVQPELRPLTANISKFQNAYGTKWNCIMAYGTILVLPVVLMFIFLQKYIVGGLTAGAVKD
jgi:multiple sugar transport system permease protein